MMKPGQFVNGNSADVGAPLCKLVAGLEMISTMIMVNYDDHDEYGHGDDDGGDGNHLVIKEKALIRRKWLLLISQKGFILSCVASLW